MAIEVGTAYVTILPKIGNNFNKQIAGTLGKAGSAGGRGFGDGFKSTFNAIIASNLATKAFNGVVGIAKNAFSGGWSRLMNLEQAEIKLNTIYQTAGRSADEVAAMTKDAMASVNAAVDGTKFAMSDAADMASQLASAGIDAGDDMTRWLKITADSAQFTGRSFGEMQSVLGRVAAEGRVTGETFQSMPIAASALAEHLGISQQEVRKLASEGKISADQLVEALEGQIGGAASNAGASFISLRDNIVTAFNAIGANLLAPIKDAMMPIMKSFLALVKLVRDDVAKPLGEAFGKFLQPKAEAFAKALDAIPGAIDAFKNAWVAADGDVTSSGLAGFAERLANGFREIYDAVVAFREAWKAADGDVTSSGLAGFAEKLAGTLRPALESLQAFFRGIMEGFGGLEGIGKIFQDLWPLISGPLGLIKSALVDTFQGMEMPGLNAAADAGWDLAQALQPVLSALGELASAITGALSEAFTAILPVLLDLAGQILPLIADVAKQLVPAFTQVVQAVTPLLPTIAELASTVVSVLGGALGQILPLIADMASRILPLLVSVINKLVPIITRVVQALSPIITQLVEKLTPIITRLIEGLLPPLMDLFESLADLCMDLFDALWPIVEALLESLIPAVATLLENLLPPLIDIFGSLVEILAPLHDLIGVLAQALSPLISLLVEILVPILTTLLNLVLQPLIGVLQLVVGAIGPVVKALANWATQITGSMIPVIEKLSSTVSTVFNAIKTVVETVIGGVKNTIETVTGTIGRIWDDAWNAIEETVTTIWNGIKQFFIDSVNAITQPFEDIGEGIKEAFRTAFNFVVDAWNGSVGKLQWEVPGWVPKIGGQHIGVPQLDHFAAGGLITGPTLGLLGEAGHEVVMPLDRFQPMLDAAVQAAGIRSSGDVYLTIVDRDGTLLDRIRAEIDDSQTASRLDARMALRGAF